MITLWVIVCKQYYDFIYIKILYFIKFVNNIIAVRVVIFIIFDKTRCIKN